MAQASNARVQLARRMLSESALIERVRQLPAPVPLRLDGSGFDLIAELKLRSPAAGVLTHAPLAIADCVGAYARAGAAAVSVLTEPDRFAGTLEHLETAAAVLAPRQIPAMRKDFLVDPYQLLEARAAGAGGALLIVRMLSVAQLDALLDCARGLGLFVLLEAFDEEDLERVRAIAAAHGARIRLLAGVNCRDLATLKVVPQRLEQLAPLLPPGVPGVAESGIACAADARRAAAAGYQLALVGSALMQGADPEALARELLAAGRGTS
jgi:indole-3-glycerol phosphate synthase